MAEMIACTLTTLMRFTKVRKNSVEAMTATVPQHLHQSEMEFDVNYLP